MSTLRLAVIGAGPAGIYAADILLKAEKKFDVSVDVFDHLPAPFGLVRYGVAPDHPRIKGVVSALRDVLDRGDIRLFGNVRFGTDLTLDDLKQHYNAVIFATGAVEPASLDIPGIGLPGSFGASEFVSWYDGHPDVPRHWPLTHREVAVIGNGNVALDVARMLAKHAEDLLPTDVPANVYDTLAESPITDVHILGRRGPTQVRFTPLELRELGELNDVDIVLYDEDFHLDPAAQQAIETNRQVFVLNRVLNGWRDKRDKKDRAASRRLHLHFYARPTRILGDAAGVTGIEYERTMPDGQGGVAGTGELRSLPVQAVYRYVALLAPSVYSGLLAQSTAVSGYGGVDRRGAARRGAAGCLRSCRWRRRCGAGLRPVASPAQAAKMIAETASSAIRAERPGARDMRIFLHCARGPRAASPAVSRAPPRTAKRPLRAIALRCITPSGSAAIASNCSSPRCAHARPIG